VQHLARTDRRPAGTRRGIENLDRRVDLVGARLEGGDDRPDLRRVDANSRVARVAARATTALSPNSVTTLCDGVLAWPWQAAAIFSLARTTSGCANWPSALIASAGIAPRCAETKSIRPNESDSIRGWAAIASTSRKAPWVSISACSGMRRAAPETESINAAASSTSATLSTLGSIR
jgi:hypothetical protein